MVVDVDEADQVVELPVARRHRRLPGRALVQLAVGHEVVDEGGRSPCASGPGTCRRRCQAEAERAAGDLHARRVGGHARHRQAAVVAAVGLQLAPRARCRPRSAPRRGRSRSGRWTAGSGRAPPSAGPPGGSASRGSRRRPARRRCRAPGRCSPGPAPRPCAAHCGGCGRRVRPGRTLDRGVQLRRCVSMRISSRCGSGRWPAAAQPWISMPPLTSMTAPVT